MFNIAAKERLTQVPQQRRAQMRTIRGKAAIVGIGEVPTRRSYEDRTTLGLCAEAVRLALDDAGLSKQDINGLVTDGGTTPAAMAEYINLRPTFATGVAMHISLRLPCTSAQAPPGYVDRGWSA